jgi:hypothetical protein
MSKIDCFQFRRAFKKKNGWFLAGDRSAHAQVQHSGKGAVESSMPLEMFP